MDDTRTILELFGVDIHYLTQVVTTNPSLRGAIVGYLSERKLWDIFATNPRITRIRKDDDHDRDNTGDLVVTYQGFDFRFEVKSLQTNSIKMFSPTSNAWIPKIIKQPLPVKSGQGRKKYKWVESELYRTAWLHGGSTARFTGNVQCDASDSRDIVLPNGHTVKTTNLKVGEFDILAMGLFAFRESWDFGFMLNRDLPRSNSAKYADDDRQYLLKTLIPVEWPLPPTCLANPFTLLDTLVQERLRMRPSRDT